MYHNLPSDPETVEQQPVNLKAKDESVYHLFDTCFIGTVIARTFERGVFSAEDTVNYPSAWDLCCNGNWDESCATMRIDCRKKLSTYYFEILKMFYQS